MAYFCLIKAQVSEPPMVPNVSRGIDDDVDSSVLCKADLDETHDVVFIIQVGLHAPGSVRGVRRRGGSRQAQLRGNGGYPLVIRSDNQIVSQQGMAQGITEPSTGAGDQDHRLCHIARLL